MPRLSVVIVSFALGALMALPAAAQWKWRGKDGNVQYSDLPPPSEVADKDILQRPNSAQRRATPPPAPAASAVASAPALTPKGVDPKLEAERKKVEDAETAKKKAEEEKQAAARAENCTKAKSYQKTLDDGIRIARTNDKGEREILDDKARAEETKRTKAIITSDCK